MTVLSDIIKILNGESSVFAFLPAVNYTFYYISQSGEPDRIALQATFAIFISTLMYNMLSELSGADDDKDPSGILGDLSGKLVLLSIFVGAAWTIAFAYSILSVRSLFESASFWPEVLVAISICFIFLLISDYISNYMVS